MHVGVDRTTGGAFVPLGVFALALIFFAPWFPAEAQLTEKVWRIGYLANAPPTPPEVARLRSAFISGLREHGYIEGRNLIIEGRYSEGRAERWPELAAQLVRLKVDVIVVNTTPGALAARNASSTIPIVHVAAIDPVGAGLAASLARPGGNVTGLAIMFPELAAKGLALLKQAQPGLSRVAVLWNAANPANAPVWAETETTAQALGLTLHSVPVRAPKDFQDAFAQVRADGLLVLCDALMFQQRRQIVEFIIQKRLPAVTQFKEMTELGALMSYGVDIADLWRRASSYVDKVLKGANPGDLPFEQPTKFELILNLKTAKSIGLTIPPSLLLEASSVIE